MKLFEELRKSQAPVQTTVLSAASSRSVPPIPGSVPPISPQRSVPPIPGSVPPISPQRSVPPNVTARQSVPPIQICWVARAVYGADNPQWMQFRDWMLTDAPSWFRNLYIRHGQRVARWITPHEGVKSLIRRWMDSVIAPK